MLKKEEMIGRILQVRVDLTREMVEEKINVKKREVGKLLTDEGAVFMVANELGIDLSGEKTLRTRINIRDLMIGASDVTVTGKVITKNQIRSFKRKNGVEGKVARLILGDQTGTVNTVLWDKKAEFAERGLSKGDVVRVNNGYMRSGLNGKPELNVGRKGSVVVLASDPNSSATYIVQEVYKKIHEMWEGESINFIGFVERVSPTSLFQRSDGQDGKVRRVRLTDEDESMIAVFWDEKTDLVQNTRRGDCIKIINGFVKKGLAGSLEMHIGAESEVSFLREEKPKKLDLKTPKITPIEKLIQKMSDVDILARVTAIGNVREFLRPSGKSGKVVDIFLMDKTGAIKLTLWDEKAEIVENISIGDVILLEGAYTREAFRGNVSLNIGKMGDLKLNPDLEEVRYLPPCSTQLVNISELKVGYSASVKGEVQEKPIVKTVYTKDGREIRVASLKIRDNSGEITASFWEDLAEQFEDMKRETVIIVRNAYVKTGFSGGLELSSLTTTKIEILQSFGEKPR